VAEVRPLPVYPSAPTGDVLSAIKEAKASMSTSILIKPVRAVPGSPGRILAIGKRPDFLCDYALVEEPTASSIKPALEWILDLRDDYKGYSAIVLLREVFGRDVEEITDGTQV
jgi:hypothetical protein